MESDSLPREEARWSIQKENEGKVQTIPKLHDKVSQYLIIFYFPKIICNKHIWMCTHTQTPA